MPSPSVCRLCVSKSLTFKKLYKRNGQSSYENDLTQKYLNTTIVNMEIAKHLTVICSQCWQHISDFHNFQQCVILAQKKLTAEIDIDKTTTILVEKQEVNDNVKIKVEAEWTLEESDVSPLEETTAQTIKLENETLFTTKPIEGDSDDYLTDFLEFDVKIENEQDVKIEMHSSDSSHRSDSEMVETPNTVDSENIKATHSNANDMETTQSRKPTVAESTLEESDVSPLEETTAQTIKLENETISETLLTAKPIEGDSDDSLTDFLDFDVKIENEQDVKIEMHSSDSSHSSDIEMVETPNTVDSENIKATHSNANDMETTQSRKPTASKCNATYKKDLNSYQRISNKELDALIHEFMPNITCRQCHEDFTSFALFRSHFRKQHPKLEFFIKCCNLKLKHRGCFEGHFRNHKCPKFFKCDFCDKSYSLKKYLNVHVLQCHPEIRHVRTHKCPKCQEAFALQYFMKLHLKTCNGDKAATSTSSNDEPPKQIPGTVCSICEKVCKNIVALRKHTWYNHRAEPKLKCNYCEETFRQNVEWREHMAIQHTGEHLFSCPNCPKTFLRRSWLLVHQKELHGIKSARSCCTPPRRCAMHSQAESTNTKTNSE